MQRKHVFAALGLACILPLSACNASGANSSPSTQSSTLATSSSSSSSHTGGQQLLGFYLPGEAPTDYEDYTPEYFISASDSRPLLILVDHYMTNHDFVSHTHGAVSIRQPLGTMMQDIAAFNIKVGNESLNHAVTTVGDDNSLGLNSGVVSYSTPNTRYSSLSTPKGVTLDSFEYYENDTRARILPGAFGSQAWEDSPNFTMFLEQVGRPTWSFTSYYLPDVSAIRSCQIKGETDDTLTFSFILNFDPSLGTDAATYYINQMRNMVASIGSLEVQIQSLTFDLTLSKDSFAPISMEVNESYQGGLAGMDVALFNVTNNLSVEFEMLGEEGLENPSIDDSERQVFQAARDREVL